MNRGGRYSAGPGAGVAGGKPTAGRPSRGKGKLPSRFSSFKRTAVVRPSRTDGEKPKHFPVEEVEVEEQLVILSESDSELSASASGLILRMEESTPEIGFVLGRPLSHFPKWTKIYTEWANHYLEKAKCKRQIADLQVDVTDGVVLADVIEAVTAGRVPEIHRKPKTASQMLDNIQSCLVFLAQLGVGLEGISARDIRDGHLKSILSLFFQLSRYKQQQKHQDRDRHNQRQQIMQSQSQHHPEMMQQYHGHPGHKAGPNKQQGESSKLPSPFCKQHTSIPLPQGGNGGSESALVNPANPSRIVPVPIGSGGLYHHSFPQQQGHPHPIRKNGPKAGHPYNSSGSLNGVKPTSGNSSRDTSPSSGATGGNGSGIPHSFIPQPTGSSSIPSAPSSARSSIHERSLPSSAKIPTGPVPTVTSKTSSSARTQNNNADNSQSALAKTSGGGGSMLEKFKFFKEKGDKGEKIVKGSPSASGSTTSSCGSSNKRTSSSSGFSSARSERSDSSVSLSESKTGVLPDGVILRRGNCSDLIANKSSQSHSQNQVDSSNPRLAIKGFRQKLGKAIGPGKPQETKQHSSSPSPKSGRKEDREREPNPNSNSNTNGRAVSGSATSRTKTSRTMTKATESNSAGGGSSGNLTESAPPPSFLRQPKSGQQPPGQNRDSRNRVSAGGGSGIPMRNSLIGGNSGKELEGNTNLVNNNNGSGNLNNNSVSVSTSSLNSTSSSTTTTNGLLQSLGNGTGIPKPTAAVKGTTKQPNKLNGDSQDVSISKPTEATLSSPLGGGKPTSIKSEGVTVALVSPMPSLTNSASMSSSESGALTQSTLSQSNSNSISNSSDVTVMLASKYKREQEQQKQSEKKLDSPPTPNSKVSPGSGFASSTASVSSSIGSLNKIGDEVGMGTSSSGTSLTSPVAPEDNSAKPQQPQQPQSHSQDKADVEESNGNSLTSEVDEEDPLHNLKPIEPLCRNSPYGYIKSPPGSTVGRAPIQMRRTENGNQNQPARNALVKSAGRQGQSQSQGYPNPYCDPARVVPRRVVPPPPGSFSTSGYASSTAGDYDYADIDNFEMSTAGYLSDGDLLSSTNAASADPSRSSHNDGYMSESGVSIYGRRPTQPGGRSQGHATAKHGVITEDSLNGVKPTSGNSSRDTSPSSGATGGNGSGIPHSFIPQPTGSSSIPSAPSSARSSIHERSLPSSAKIPTGPVPTVTSKTSSSARTQNNNADNSQSALAKTSGGGGSMLEKFKFFKEKGDKGEKIVKGSPSASGSTTSSCGSSNKRTSSSSGFSSARSERSDSSVSLSESKTGVLPDGVILRRGNCSDLIANKSSQSHSQNQVDSSNPRLAIKGFRQKLGKAIGPGKPQETKQHSSSPSPKSGRKEDREREPNPNSNSNTNGRAVSGSATSRTKTSRTMTKATESNSAGGGSSGNLTESAPPPSFLRQPKSGQQPPGQNRDSRNRVSAGGGSGIPMRNSLIGGNSGKELEGNTNLVNNNNGSGNLNNNSVSVSTSSLNSTSSSTTTTNGLLQSLGNGTGIPKPTAAVKGTTKQPNKLNGDSQDVSISKPTEATLSSPLGGGKPTSIKSEGVTVALVSPMPSLTNSASMSSSESGALTQSTLSQSNSNSISNSSDVTVMLASKYKREQEQQKQSEKKLDSPPTPNSKVSPGSGFASSTASVSSSIGSLNKIGDEVGMGTSSSGTSLTSPVAPEDNSAKPQQPQQPQSHSQDKADVEESNGNSLTSEVDEEDPLHNLKPIEPLCRNSPYGYIKSPPGSTVGRAPIQMRRTENGNQNQPARNALVKSAGRQGQSQSQGYPNPYCDPARVVPRRVVPPPPGSFSTSGYASSTAGDYDYADIDNFEMSTAGYLSDGDLLSSTNAASADPSRSSHNDGYMSESGVSIYGRRPTQPGGRSQGHATAKHGVITEDSFDDSSSISSGISDLNEIPTDLTSSSVNSEVSSPYDSLQRGGKGLNSLSRRRESPQQSIIYRVVGGSRTKRSTGADTSDLHANTNNYSPSQGRAATLPSGFVDPNRVIAAGKGSQKQGHLVSNLRGSESSSSLRRVASPGPSQSPVPIRGGGGSGDYASANSSARLRQNGEGSRTGQRGMPMSMNNLDKNGGSRKGMMAGGSMTEAESMESLSSSSSVAVQLRDGRSNSLTHNHNHGQARIQSAQQHQQGRDQASPSRSPRLNRSNSIRSTKSEKLYPSMLERNNPEGNSPYYSSTMSQGGVPTLPTSPIHGPTSRICSGSGPAGVSGAYTSSAASTSSVRLSMSPYSGFLAKLSAKEDEINASSLSLVSTASSLYSSQEDKHAHEVRKLRRELVEAQEKVQTLTNQLTTNAHVVAAFEQSLSNMTQRLQTLTLTAELKDSELTELKQTIELLRKQSVEAGLTMAQIAGACGEDGGTMARQLSADSVSSINSISSACSGQSHSHTSSPSGRTPTHGPSNSSGMMAPESPGSQKKKAQTKGKGWLRSSFTKAFSRGKSKSRNDSSPEHHGVDGLGGLEEGNYNGFHYATVGPAGHGHGHPSHLHHRTIPQSQPSPHNYSHNGGVHNPLLPTSPLLSPPPGDGRKNSSSCSVSTGSHSSRSNGGAGCGPLPQIRLGSISGLEEPVVTEEPRSVDELRKQLREKEMVLTDIRLEALTSAHQLESLKETVTKMRNEMMSLKQDNERLQRLVTCKSLTSSQSSLQKGDDGLGLDRRLSAAEQPPQGSSPTLDLFLTGMDGTGEKEGKTIVVSVYLGSGEGGFPPQECAIGTITVGNKTKWDGLDQLVRRALKDYLMRIDPMSSLGLGADSVLSYSVGEVVRRREGPLPELLPVGYLVGEVNKVRVSLRGARSGELDALSFETLVPKSVLQRYLTLLGDNGRILICGPSGTGKSYLARKLGEWLVAREGKDPCPEAIASFSADHKNGKELRQYLTNLVEQCEAGEGLDLPSVIILDNLHQVQNLGEILTGLKTSPVIIGTMTMSQSQTQPPPHNFRWISFANHTEPVRGLLARYLQRRLIEVDTQNGSKNLELARVVDWIPKVWLHVNKFLELHNSAEVTIGPRLFLACPMDVGNSQVWFSDLWHYSVVPYVIEAVKEGLQMYGKKGQWEDPSQYLMMSWPWGSQNQLATKMTGKSGFLQRIRAEDVGYDKSSGGQGENGGGKEGTNGGDADPLMNMLLRLQEAANYSGPQSNDNDSDSTSMDSHVSLDPKDFIAA